uniref:Uncharacterized protein n=1 Tax=Anguilla anguilla TaxID=7936 RepID=A0A0E9P5Y2_ANGAN
MCSCSCVSPFCEQYYFPPKLLLTSEN